MRVATGVTAIFLVLIIVAGARSAEPMPTKPLTVGQIITIGNVLMRISCQDKVIKDGAKESFVCEPYSADKLKPGLSWQIAGNLSKATEITSRFQRAHNQALIGQARKPDGALTDEAQSAMAAHDAGLLEMEEKIDFERFKRAEIEPLNLPPAIISALMPIIDP